MTIQQALLVGGKPPVRTYMDEVFKITGYTGNGVSGSGTRTITHGLNYGDDGGMVMTKMTKHGNNDQYRDWYVYSTSLSGSHKTNAGVYADVFHSGGELTATNNTYQVTGTGFKHNANDKKYVNYMFKKTTGFFTYKNYTGTGSTQTMTHDLGVTPAMIWIHRTNMFNTTDWAVYHRNINKGVNPQNHRMWLNREDAAGDEDLFGDTAPTATHFTVGGSHNETNADGDNYTAYFFAGDESTAATARSVDFDGTGDYLSTGSSSADFSMGTGDFTIECWYKPNHPTDNEGIFQLSPTANGLANSTNSLAIGHVSSTFTIYGKNTDTSFTMKRVPGQWHHIAYVRSSGVSKVYINGAEKYSTSDTTDYTATYIAIGGYYSTSYLTNGSISNFRVVKGTAVYTSSFRPPTKPLTNITNTKLLCCNNSSTTGSTVTPETITANGDPTASTDSPFDDPDAAIFGSGGDEPIIKCGGYTGNGDTTNGTKIHLGFEPQLVLIKSASYDEEWHIFDDMTGMKTNEDIRLELSYENQGLTGGNFLDVDAHGFTALYNPNINKDGEYYIYMAIRREDGYVQKPADAGTDVFTMDTGNSSSTIPAMDTTFTVDMTIYTQPASQSHNWLTARMLGTRDNGKELKINAAESEGNVGDSQWDTHVGWGISANSNYQAWMWKRGAGFDVVTYKGNEVEGRSIPHSLGKIPEMIWIKNRDSADHWAVYHKGLNGGTNPEQYYLWLETDGAEDSTSVYWNNTAPTSTHFTVGNGNAVNQNNKNYIAMLFANVSGISAVGSYTGGPFAQEITLGFQPRFVLIKGVESGKNWVVLDSTRGMDNTNDPYFLLNSDAAQDSSSAIIGTSSTSMTVLAHSAVSGSNSGEHIYYAHA